MSSSEQISAAMSEPSSAPPDLSTSPSNIYIYTALAILFIAVIYILYKQSTLNNTSDNSLIRPLPAYGSWYGNTLADADNAINWIRNSGGGITDIVGINYNSSNGSFTFTYPGLYKVSFSSFIHMEANNENNYYIIYLRLNGNQFHAGSSSNNVRPVDMGNDIGSSINNIVRISNTTDYLQLTSFGGKIPGNAYLSIYWIGL